MRRVRLGLIILIIIGLYGCFNVFSPLFVDPATQDLSTIGSVNFLNDMGDYYADIGDYETAKKFYQRALEIDPSSSRALIGIANCEMFSIIPRTNIVSFYERTSKDISSIMSNSNYSDLVEYYVTNETYYQSANTISSNLYIVITGKSDNKLLTNDDNLHFSFSIFNKINSFFVSLDTDDNGKINSNDLLYNFLKKMTNSLESNFIIPNEFIIMGHVIKSGMNTFFFEGQKSIRSLSFVTNKLNSKDSSIEVQILKAFKDLDTQITNVYTNFTRYHNFYVNMYNRIVELLTNNGIPIEIATNITKLTNSLNVTNYATFDNEDITNILTTNNSSAWDILTNYLDLNKLTN
ncbi:MAG: tetratricopeptide repeat protein [Brevinematia bacterium]